MASPEEITRVSLNSWQNKDLEEEDEENRITMFHVVYGQMKENIVLQQLIVIARLPHDPADVTELGDHYENLIFELSKQRTPDHITGLLLIYPTCLLHVIESSREELNTILKDMQRQPDRQDMRKHILHRLIQQDCGKRFQSLVLLEAKVIFMAHNLQSRLFNHWSYKVLNADQVARKDAVEEDEEENIEALVHSVLSALQQLKEHLVTGVFPGLLLDEKPGLIISQNILEKLLSEDEFLSPQQHLEMYNSPLNITVEIGQVNPRSFLPTV